VYHNKLGWSYILKSWKNIDLKLLSLIKLYQWETWVIYYNKIRYKMEINVHFQGLVERVKMDMHDIKKCVMTSSLCPDWLCTIPKSIGSWQGPSNDGSHDLIYLAIHSDLLSFSILYLCLSGQQQYAYKDCTVHSAFLTGLDRDNASLSRNVDRLAVRNFNKNSSLLPLPTLLACQIVNHHLHDLVSDSVEIQYALHCEFAMQLNTDNPRCEIPVKERLTQLSTREMRWQKFVCNSQSTTHIPFKTYRICDLSGGIFLLGDASRRMLYYAYLPSSSEEQVVWKSLATSHLILIVGLCVYEHDLIAVVTT